MLLDSCSGIFVDCRAVMLPCLPCAPEYGSYDDVIMRDVNLFSRCMYDINSEL